MQRLTSFIAATALLVLSAPVDAQTPNPTDTGASGMGMGAGSNMTANKPTTITFAAQNGSGETGTATLTPSTGGSTTVTITLKGAPDDPQPAHIHEGTCAHLNPAPKFPLTPVAKGTSTSTVPASLASLESGQYAINVHKSTSDLKTYVACANITAGSSGMQPPSHTQ